MSKPIFLTLTKLRTLLLNVSRNRAADEAERRPERRDREREERLRRVSLELLKNLDVQPEDLVALVDDPLLLLVGELELVELGIPLLDERFRSRNIVEFVELGAERRVEVAWELDVNHPTQNEKPLSNNFISLVALFD